MIKRASNFYIQRPGWPFHLIFIALTLVACQKGAIEPVAIAAEDVCTQCKMAISEKRFTAEYISRDGQPFKFDDIMCLIGYMNKKQNRANIAAYFVMDFDSRQWLKAEAAHYVQSPEIKAPMRGGVVAFRDEAKASEAAALYHGKTLGFDDLFHLED